MKLGPSSTGPECSTIQLDEGEFVTAVEVGYSSTDVKYLAVILNTGEFRMWGADASTSKKKWNFPTAKYNLIGLYGSTDGSKGINMLGTIVFNSEKCATLRSAIELPEGTTSSGGMND